MTEPTKQTQEVPRYRVTQAPGFFDGASMKAVGEEFAWEPPEGWNEAKNGPHYTKAGPSQSFQPMNPAAEKLQAEHRARIAKAAIPRGTEVDELKKVISKQNEQFMALMETVAKLTKK